MVYRTLLILLSQNCAHLIYFLYFQSSQYTNLCFLSFLENIHKTLYCVLSGYARSRHGFARSRVAMTKRDRPTPYYLATRPLNLIYQFSGSFSIFVKSSSIFAALLISVSLTNFILGIGRILNVLFILY